MRLAKIASILILLSICPSLTAVDAAPAAPTVEFHIAGKQPDDSSKAAFVKWGLEVLKSANFNTVNEPQILRQGVPLIQDHYRAALASDYVLIRYDRPTAIETISGDIKVYDIVIGLARHDQVISSLFTVDDEGRVVSHEKYAGVLSHEVAKALGIPERF